MSAALSCDTVWTAARLLPMTDLARPDALIDNAVVAAKDGRIVYAGPADMAPALAADQTVESIYEKVALLKRFPELGCRHEPCKPRNLRILLFGHYRIAYLIKPDGNIDVVGVFHAALDIDRYLTQKE